MLNVVWHLAQVLLASSQTLPSRCFVMALSMMTESALDTTDQMLRTMYPTWWRAFGQKQDLDTSGVGTVTPWWDAWDTDETAAKPNAAAAVEKEVEKEVEWDAAAPPTDGMALESTPPPRPPPRTPPRTPDSGTRPPLGYFIKESRRPDGRTRRQKKPFLPPNHALTISRRSAAMQRYGSRSN